MDIGKEIKTRRKELNISADELAEYVGVSPSTIFRYEKGDIEKMPTVVLEKIARKLRTRPGVLMGWEEENKAESSYIETIAAHIDDNVTDEEMEEILDYINYIKSKHKK